MRLTTKNLNRCAVCGRKPLVSTHSHCFRPCADYKSKDEKCQENFDNERDERNFYYSARSSKNISRVLHKLRGGNGNAGFAFSRHGFRSGNTRVDSPNRNGCDSFGRNCQLLQITTPKATISALLTLSLFSGLEKTSSTVLNTLHGKLTGGSVTLNNRN